MIDVLFVILCTLLCMWALLGVIFCISAWFAVNDKDYQELLKSNSMGLSDEEHQEIVHDLEKSVALFKKNKFLFLLNVFVSYPYLFMVNLVLWLFSLIKSKKG